MLVGYARVSTLQQNLDLQISALRSAGCKRIYRDHGISGSGMKRPGLKRAIKSLSEGDQFVVWRLDRLGRSLSGVVQAVDALAQNKVEFRSLTEGFDTTSTSGKLIFHIMAALAEFERDLISERTKAGMEVAALRGKRIGRPPLLTDDQIRQIASEIKRGRSDTQTLASRFGISPRTLQRYLNKMREKECTV